MSRTIKFRGKRIDNGEWVYGYYVNDTILGHRILCSTNHYFNVDAESIGQFTGITDKNGKEIYEGDICKKYYGSSIPTFIVAWTKERAMFIQFDGYNEPLFEANNKYIEVIGNTTENQIC